MEGKSIVFLHLSDMHINLKKDISNNHILKIVDAINTYKDTFFDNVIIIISGDITASGKESQFNNAKKLIGGLISNLNRKFNCKCTVFLVPGNHDVNHNGSPLPISSLQNEKYSDLEVTEHKKLRSFYSLAKFNRCFEASQIFCDSKTISIDNLKIQVNMINNAIFSTIGSYNGLLYFPKEDMERISKVDNSDFAITIMHHAPDYYRDDIKIAFEEAVIKSSKILFHGHEHNNRSKHTLFDNSAGTIIQSGGSLCNNGDWTQSSYVVGLLNVDTLEYKSQRFQWNLSLQKYTHDEIQVRCIENSKPDYKVSDEFLEFINENYNEKYFVFPLITYRAQESTKDFQIKNSEDFIEELLKHPYSTIIGPANVGKTTLLKYIFKTLYKDYCILFGSPEKILEKSKSKKQNIGKLIESLFYDIYGNNNERYQDFEQKDKEKCIFILDDFEQIDGINLSEFFSGLGRRFGHIIIANNRIIDFDPYNIAIDDKKSLARFEIKALVGPKRRELIRAVVKEKASDKSKSNVDGIVSQIDRTIKTQMRIIPPDPYYIIQITENFMNNVGEAIYKSSDAFSKVFEANMTNRLDYALRSRRNNNITVDLMYVLLGKIAYYIHFHKAYPIKRKNIDDIVTLYVEEYGNSVETEDIIYIAKTAGIIQATPESRETYRFCNRSILAYFVAKGIIAQKDNDGLKDVINKACINICTDILLFVIYLTDETTLLDHIIQFISDKISSDSMWNEFSIPGEVPYFIMKNNEALTNGEQIYKSIDKNELEKSEEISEETMVKEFTINDLYDWDDDVIDEKNNRLIRMTSLLQIVSRCLPCFEHRLKKSQKEQVINVLYTLPNRIFMYWCHLVEENYEGIISELKTFPYFHLKKVVSDNEIDFRVKKAFAAYAMNILLSLYYIPALNAVEKNTTQYLNSKDFFDYSRADTYTLEHLMFLEQDLSTNKFVEEALNIKKNSSERISSYLLSGIVHHGLITRNDSKADVSRLESKFFPQGKKDLLIERTKNKFSKV